jgi:regulator of protease activity HflC (stomatin/prohibitin superfamily)
MSQRDPFYGAILLVLSAATLGGGGALAAGLLLSDVVLLDVAVTLGLAAGVLAGVAAAKSTRARTLQAADREMASASPQQAAATVSGHDSSEKKGFGLRLAAARRRIRQHMRQLDVVSTIRAGTGVAGAAAVVLLLVLAHPARVSTPRMIATAASLCLLAAVLAATAARYFADIDRIQLPEGLGLSRGARVTTWILVVAALSLGLQYANLSVAVRTLHFILVAVNAAICVGLITLKRPDNGAADVFPLDLGALSLLGGRANILGSVLDSAERQLGIDLRSTWALAVVRRSIEPLVIGLCLMGWLATSLSVIGLQDEGLVERLGVPLATPLQSGLHLHWPWPIDRVIRIPVRRVQVIQIGHKGEESGGPENVLWAVEHASNEYTLLLGNGRDLITIDAVLQYRIADAHAWYYNTRNPAEALQSIAYRAVMRNTVNRTLTEAISENMLTLTARMRAMVQQDANAMGLGVQVVAFTVGGFHPPVPVALAYEDVVSAQLGMVTAVAGAEGYQNQTMPAAAAATLMSENTANADGAEALATAAGEAWSFRTLETQYRVAKQEYFFRRRLETFENVLGGRGFTIVDSRIQREGGELWLTP